MEKHGRERERGKGDSAEGGLFRAKYKGEGINVRVHPRRGGERVLCA